MSRIARVYTDAGVIKVGLSPHGFTWAYCHVSAEDELIASDSGYCHPSQFHMLNTENNFAETYAAMKGLESLTDGAEVTMYLDNKNALRRLSQVTSWNGVPDAVRLEIAQQLSRVCVVSFVLLGGHPCQKALETGRRCGDGKPVSKWNAKCDSLCNEAKAIYHESVKETLCRQE